MSKNSLIYIVLWLLIQLLIEINCQIAPFKRYGHTATLIDNKLYILGGKNISNDDEKIVGKQFFYLDVSVSFKTQELLWINLTGMNDDPSHTLAASVNGGSDNNTLFLFGGFSLNSNETMDLVYTFNAKTNSMNK